MRPLPPTLNALSVNAAAAAHRPPPTVEWSWDLEHADRTREAKADAALHNAHPFQVDRKVLKDVVRGKFERDVGRITFLSAGTFHKAYLVTLVDGRELVARVARRFMPRLKTESEVATMHYMRHYTSVPVPIVYHYDPNPYNRLGGEYILMSKAPGIPLSQVYHSMTHGELLKLLDNIVSLVLPLFAHRFTHLGSLYFSNPAVKAPSMARSWSSQSFLSSSIPTPKASHSHMNCFPLAPIAHALPPSAPLPPPPPPPPPRPSSPTREIHVGPIISWPFFGSNRGELTHPSEIDRGPWPTTRSYLLACAAREIDAVIRENEGRAAPHRLHLDPDEILSSRHHKIKSVPGDRSDESDEWELEESEEEWEGPGDAMYRDYRRMQRGTFLVAHMVKREQAVRAEMRRWVALVERLGVAEGSCSSATAEGEEFGLDLHDLSLENIFVDSIDHSRITCIIDWESTTTRPLWACAHLPAFVQASPFTADLFREAVSKIAASPHLDGHQKWREGGDDDGGGGPDLPSLAREWLHHEAGGARLRLAHRFVEWDGWEEGLVDSILGLEEHQEEWFRDTCGRAPGGKSSGRESKSVGLRDGAGRLDGSSDAEDESESEEGTGGSGSRWGGGGGGDRKPDARRLVRPLRKEKCRTLEIAGDVCGGRGGELGRRLEAWLSVSEGD